MAITDETPGIMKNSITNIDRTTCIYAATHQAKGTRLIAMTSSTTDTMSLICAARGECAQSFMVRYI
jgi:hypothetical protein